MAIDFNDHGLWTRLLRKLGWAPGAQDVEDSLHSAWIRLERYRKTTDVKDEEAFLVRASRNLLIDQYRRRATLSESPVEDECAAMADPAPLQDEVLDARNRLVRVQAGLDQLPPRTRQVFEMHRLDRMKYREIADRLGISVSAVEKHIARASLFLAQWTKGW